jgi:hypothetical protein
MVNEVRGVQMEIKSSELRVGDEIDSFRALCIIESILRLDSGNIKLTYRWYALDDRGEKFEFRRSSAFVTPAMTFSVLYRVPE